VGVGLLTDWVIGSGWIIHQSIPPKHHPPTPHNNYHYDSRLLLPPTPRRRTPPPQQPPPPTTTTTPKPPPLSPLSLLLPPLSTLFAALVLTGAGLDAFLFLQLKRGRLPQSRYPTVGALVRALAGPLTSAQVCCWANGLGWSWVGRVRWRDAIDRSIECEIDPFIHLTPFLCMCMCVCTEGASWGP
jgi:hypothetical protein